MMKVTLRSEMSELPFLCRLTFVIFLAFAMLTSHSLINADYVIAIADDDNDDDDSDDDDDDDDSSSGSRSSGSSGAVSGASSNGIFKKIFKRNKSKSRNASPRRASNGATAKKRPAPSLPDFANAEIVALNLVDDDIAALEATGYTVIERNEIGLIDAFVTRLQVPEGVALEDARQAVREVQPLSRTDFNHFYRPGSSACSEPWCVAPAMVNWPQSVSQQNVCIPSVSIGLIDTGINIDHSALEGADLTLIDTTKNGAPSSSRQHGTAVVSLLAGNAESRSPGLLKNAKIYAIDAFYRPNGHDQRTDVYTLVQSLDELAARGVGVINLSLAGPPNELLKDMIATIRTRNIFLVAAAGNAGPKSEPAYPGAYDEVFSVTAIDAGKKVYRRAGRGEHIDFAAPGVNVWVAASVRGAKQRTGTSFATPFMTATLAMLKTNHPELTSYELAKKRLIEQSEDLGEAGFDTTYGHGLLSAEKICQGAPGSVDTNQPANFVPK